MFVKLFEQILDSSIAENYKTRLVFEDMLLLADKNGILDMTHEAFARRTNVPLKVVKAAITQLEQPDPQSRRPDCDGRRIVKIDENREWGWRLVNFEHYRKMRNEEDRAEYMRNYMRNFMADKRKEEKLNDEKDDYLTPVRQCLTPVRQKLASLANADAESESDAESDKEEEEEERGAPPPVLQVKNRFFEAIQKLRIGHIAFKTVPDVAIENALKGWPVEKWNEAITSLCHHYAGANIPKPIKTLENYLAGKNQQGQKNPIKNQPDKKSFEQIRDEIITKLEEAALSGGNAISRCLSACHNIYHDKKVINEAYEIFKFRNKKAGG